ncbi:MAG: RDD family protein [Candidatus Limnocylindrales bacterium]
MDPNTNAWAQPVEPAGPAAGLSFGGAGERLVAYIVDGFIVGIVNIVLILIGFALLVTVFWLAVLPIIAVFVVSLGYFPYFWKSHGQTPGMRMFQLYVVRDRDGGPISTGQAILRLIGYWVDGLVFYLGFIWILIDSRKRGWHDLIAGTVVVKRH